MNIQISISLAAEDSVPTASPAEMLTALGGDPGKDSINVSVSASSFPAPPETKPAEGGPLP